MALDGIVYNITPYVRFHPGGGKELLRGAGRDGTKLFSKSPCRSTKQRTDSLVNTHSWVNYTHMLQECIVGPLVRK
jgi:cytochrome b involved in lipid metabolism